MNQRIDYEHLETDVDGTYYWWINKDVLYCSNCCHIDKQLDLVVRYFYRKENLAKAHSLYYKGTRLYFTYKDVKYHLSWVFYSRSLIEDTIKKLKLIGAVNIQINYGELD